MLGQLVCMLYWEWLDISFFFTNSENLCFAVTFLLQLPLSLLEVPNIRRRNKNRHFTIAACLESVTQAPSWEMTST